VIRLESLHKRHGEVAAVDDVSLALGPGITAIIGPNGAGKSTLLSAIGRLIGVDAGSVEVAGLDVATTRSRLLARRLAVLRQDNHLAIRLTVDDLVGYGRFPHGDGRSAADRAAVDQAIGMLGLDEVRGKFLDELSGGQRQRAFIAMSLAQDADHLLLDEPLNNLDPRHAVALLQVLRGLADERTMTIVVVLHDVGVAARFADRVVAMVDGRVVHEGPVDEVLTEQRLSAMYRTPVRVAEVDGRRVILWG